MYGDTRQLVVIPDPFSISLKSLHEQIKSHNLQFNIPISVYTMPNVL